MRTFTRTHVHITFANPYLTCDQCKAWVEAWHDDDRCGCDDGFWNEPCGHQAGATSVCPSWGPVDGCSCQEHLGHVPHGEPPRKVVEHQPDAEDARVDVWARGCGE